MTLKESSFVARLRQRRAHNVIAVVILGCAIGAGTIGFVVSASRRSSPASSPTRVGTSGVINSAAAQAGRQQSRSLARLLLQPEAARMGRRLGERFIRGGRETATLDGTLVISNDRRPVRIVRTQQKEGEEIGIAFGAGPGTHHWTSDQGAQANGRSARGTDRELIERIVLDSPDQFIQAQLRGASYRVVGRNVGPPESAGKDDYEGPRWDLIRVAEPANAQGETKPESLWRLFYVNSGTGLIDRVVSQDGGETVVAEIGGWTTRGGETVPTEIRWTRGGTVVMQLTIHGVDHGPRR